MSQTVIALLLLSIISALLGVFWIKWPDTARKLDNVARLMRSQEKQRAYVKGFGYVMLGIAGAALLAIILTFWG